MLRIEPLGPQHDRESFDCGQPELEDYLKRIARQHADKGGFLPLTDDPLRLFLPLATLKRAMPNP